MLKPYVNQKKINCPIGLHSQEPKSKNRRSYGIQVNEIIKSGRRNYNYRDSEY